MTFNLKGLFSNVGRFFSPEKSNSFTSGGGGGGGGGRTGYTPTASYGYTPAPPAPQKQAYQMPKPQQQVYAPQPAYQPQQQPQQNYQPQQPSGPSGMEQKYLEYLQTPPNYADLYGQYSEQTGLKESQSLLKNLDNTLLDLEGQIGGIQKELQKAPGPSRMVTGRIAKGQAPLREQYAEILRRREPVSREISSRAGMVEQLLKQSQSQYGSTGSYLEALMKMSEASEAEQWQKEKFYTTEKRLGAEPGAKGTAGERQAGMVRQSVINDVKAGITTEDLAVKYGNSGLDMWELMNLYNQYSIYGPMGESPGKFTGWAKGLPKVGGTTGGGGGLGF